jgi:pilus assembly protein Flp/PilA
MVQASGIILSLSPGAKVMKALFNKFVREEAGQDLIEYGLLIGIITVGAITAILAIGPKVTSYFTTLNTNLP